MDKLIQNLNRFWVGSEIGFSSINFELKGNLFDTKVSIFYLDLIAQKYLLLLMKNVSKLALKMDELIQNLNRFWVGSEIGFNSINFELIGNLFDTKISIFYLDLIAQKCLLVLIKNVSKLALKTGELIQNLNRFWVGSEIGFSSINFELIGNLFDTKISIFYLDLIAQKYLLLLIENVSDP
jgi:high-affinity nickel permease